MRQPSRLTSLRATTRRRRGPCCKGSERTHPPKPLPARRVAGIHCIAAHGDTALNVHAGSSAFRSVSRRAAAHRSRAAYAPGWRRRRSRTARAAWQASLPHEIGLDEVDPWSRGRSRPVAHQSRGQLRPPGALFRLSARQPRSTDAATATVPVPTSGGTSERYRRRRRRWIPKRARGRAASHRVRHPWR